ncbi:MAG TPA: hypothetical protein VEJ38_04710 [Candidatus Acidoferrales bacterium]|nr:hypothetical protein [Candidatus Acidoferrales bacterium]
MSYYAVLSVASVLILLGGIQIWRKTRTIAFPLGIAMLYYWSLFGGWFLTIDLRGGDTGMRYQYLFYKILPVHLDSEYLWTLILYSLFILTIEVTVLCLVRPRRIVEPSSGAMRISHSKILIIALFAGLAGFALVRDSLGRAADLHLSPYELGRNDAELGPGFTVYQLLDRTALVALSTGLAVFLSGSKARYIEGKRTPTALAGYVALFAGMYWLNLRMGNRNAMVVAVIGAGLFYLANAIKPSALLFITCLVLGVAAVGIVGLTRGNVFGTIDNMGWWTTLKNAILDNQFSNEPFAAHMSLYGCLSRRIPVTYGSSFAFMAMSIVPAIFGVPRPPGIYQYYGENVGALEGQGYTIHHAAGWYLNFGVPGLLIGAMILGWLWATLFNRFCGSQRQIGYWRRLFAILAFWSFTAFIPDLVRAGPEAYKSVISECLLMPTFIFGVAGIKLALYRNRPVLAPL